MNEAQTAKSTWRGMTTRTSLDIVSNDFTKGPWDQVHALVRTALGEAKIDGKVTRD